MGDHNYCLSRLLKLGDAIGQCLLTFAVKVGVWLIQNNQTGQAIKRPC